MVNLDFVKLGLKQNSIWTLVPGDLFDLKVIAATFNFTHTNSW